MLIGIDASRANVEKKTGTEWYAYHVIQALKKYPVPGLEYVLYSKKFLRDGLEELPEGWDATILRWPVKRFWNQLRLSQELMKNKVDLFFQPTHTLPLYKPRRSVTTLHDVGFERLPKLYGRSELRYHRYSAKLAIKRANRILTVSEFSKREIMDVYKVPEDRITVTHLGYDASRYHPNISDQDKNAVLAKYRLSRPYFMYIGRLEEKKNIVNLIHAFSIFKGWRGVGDPIKLLLVGAPGLGFERIKKEIADRNMEEHVVMPGYVPEEEIPALMSAADALTFTSYYEGFGIPIIQAQACGTPVITSNVASMPEVGGDAALYASPGAPEQIAETMKAFTSEATLRERLRSAGFENIKRFSWNETARKTLNVLLEVLGIQHQV